jgi:hypothetical protein
MRDPATPKECEISLMVSRRVHPVMQALDEEKGPAEDHRGRACDVEQDNRIISTVGRCQEYDFHILRPVRANGV